MSATAAPAPPLRRVDGDLTSDLAHAGDVHVFGGVGAVQLNARALRVSKDVEGARIVAQAAVQVAGDMIGRPGSRCAIGGMLTCRSARDITLVVAGDVVVSGDLTSARTCSGRTVRVEGAIVGGKTSANGGLTCDSVGDEAGTPTMVSAGVDLYFQAVVARRQPDIERDRALADRTREQVKPLMERQKTLSPAERESMTVTLYEADQLAQAAEGVMNELRVVYQRSQAQALAQINVRRVLHANVTVRLGGTTTLISDTLQGPLTLVATTENGTPGVLARNTETDDKRFFPATTVDQPLAAVEAFLKPAALAA